MIYIELDSEGFLLGYNTKKETNNFEISNEEAIEISKFIKPKKVNGFWIEGLTNDEITTIKNQKLHELNILQDIELQPTDFYIIRVNDPTDGRPIPEEIKKQRKEIREKYDKLKINI